MISSNKHIKEYLDFYCKNNNKLPFAVLIKGEWGSGKTYFINKYKGKKNNFLFISLYGISNIEEINDNILYASYPKFKSSNGKLVVKAFASILKNKIGIEIKSKTLIDINKNLENKILIFDDLERTKIPIDEILGYINTLVEFQKQKVILLMNESEILREEEKEKYLKIKEKTIGRVFEVIPNPTKAINSFIKDGVKNKVLKLHNKEIKEIIFKVFVESNHNNLRLIRLGLIEFDYNFENFQSNFLKRKNKELLKYFIYEFFIYYIEFHKGEIPIEFFEKDNFYSALEIISPRDKRDNTLPTKGTVFEKYKDNGFWLSFFELESFKNIFLGKKLTIENIDSINKKIKSHIKVKDDDWAILWDWQSNFLNNDSEFFKLLKKVNSKWERKQYKDLFVIIHIFGMQLYFSKVKMLNKTMKSIEKESREYIEFLIEKKIFPEVDIDDVGYHSWSGASYGKGYTEYDSKEFKRFIQYIIKRQKELKFIFMKEKIELILKPVLEERSVSQELTELFINNNFSYRKSYFQYIDEDYLYKIITKNRLTMIIWRDILNKRWNNTTDEGLKYLKDEILFIKKINKIFKNNIKKLKKKFSTNTPTSILLKSLSDILSKKEKMLLTRKINK